MFRRAPLLLTLCLLPALSAHADIWECVDESGNKRFTNIKAEAKGCKLLSVVVPSNVPADKPQPKAAEPPPKSFPKVDTQTQRRRDDDRRRILGQELANELKLLQQARKDLAEQESQRFGSERNYQRVLDRLEPYQKKVKLHEDNVANLKRELANIK